MEHYSSLPSGLLVSTLAILVRKDNGSFTIRLIQNLNG